MRPSAFTSLRIFKDLRDGRLTVGLVHPPVPYPDRLASQALARVPFDHVAVPQTPPAGPTLDHRGDGISRANPCCSSNATMLRPTTMQRVAYCAALDVRPAWVMHPATQVERMLDMVAVGSGIGWLNAWQAAHVSRDGVEIRPLRPIERFDEFHLVWRIDDHSKSVKQFVEIAMEACKS